MNGQQYEKQYGNTIMIDEIPKTPQRTKSISSGISRTRAFPSMKISMKHTNHRHRDHQHNKNIIRSTQLHQLLPRWVWNYVSSVPSRNNTNNNTHWMMLLPNYYFYTTTIRPVLYIVTIISIMYFYWHNIYHMMMTQQQVPPWPQLMLLLWELSCR